MSRVSMLAVCVGLSLAPAMAWALGAPIDQATPDQRAEATKRFKEARKAFDERRFVDAISGFQASYDVVASPNTHLMIAHAMREFGRHAEAYEVLGEVVDEARRATAIADKYQATVQRATDELAALRPKIALLTITVTNPEAGATLTVAGRAVPDERRAMPIPVDPGPVTIVYQGAGAPILREVTAEPGTDVDVTLALVTEPADPQPPIGDPPPKGDSSWPWIWTGTQRYIAYGLAGLGVGAFVGSAVTGSLAASKHSDLQDACGDDPCPDRQDDIDSGRTMMTVTNALVIGGAALVAGGVVLWLTAPEGEDATQEAVSLRFGPGSLSIGGRF